MSNITKLYFQYLNQRIVKTFFVFDSVFTDLVNEALLIDDYSEAPVLNQILTAEDVDIRDKIVTIIDLVAAGIETVHILRS